MLTQLLTVEEVAELCRTAPATVRYWRYTGTGPRSAKIGRRVLYRREDVDQWLDERYAASAANA
ncbi:helix-turn-helix transcriptional regulator [Demequina rhizosphaerae]|uniref:helix-turn-helix transcriptional regulator n=1 Tax=Demequina rhizosphaerae TaxID=1638985 RepID=UPI000785F76E|nr:helix-turn-helix domain-containing protein [Demequina rhizosphaerae]